MKKRKEELKCTQVTKMIPDFINRKMHHRELEHFMTHIRECENCREELSIQFLVNVGLSSLEAGNTFDLQEELDTALQEAHRRVQLYHFLNQSLIVLEIVAGFAAVILALLVFLWW